MQNGMSYPAARKILKKSLDKKERSKQSALSNNTLQKDSIMSNESKVSSKVAFGDDYDTMFDSSAQVELP